MQIYDAWGTGLAKAAPLTMRARTPWTLGVLFLSLGAAPLLHAQEQPPAKAQTAAEKAAQAHAAKYPLRLHVLAIDSTHKTVRMQPNWASGSMPEMSDGAMSGGSGGGGVTLGGGSDDFTGTGRADLVTPPNGAAGQTRTDTVGLDFSYEGCSRIRVAPGFQALEARWKRPGSKLEVIIPTEAIKDGPVPTTSCTLKVVPKDFVYLRLPNGKIARVTEDAYAKKPSLRMFLSGGAETLKRRTAKLPEGASQP